MVLLDARVREHNDYFVRHSLFSTLHSLLMLRHPERRRCEGPRAAKMWIDTRVNLQMPQVAIRLDSSETFCLQYLAFAPPS
ncbi:MAG: hypothetical protein RLZZ273_664 [Bacteroidota bacterium]|jgi:hypothetical protein